jgi:hypothetical protein
MVNEAFTVPHDGFGKTLALGLGREEKELRHDVHIADRAALHEAVALIERLGDFAGSEAALRADRSRVLGNFIHFCRWRQIERMIVMLRDEAVTGAVH